MRERLLAAATLAAVTVWSSSASAATIGLFEYAFNVDGVVNSGSDPVGANTGGFDKTTGLGTITVTTGGVGSRYIGLFLDHEIDEATNTFFNESGAANGVAGGGLSWEIDEPGFVFGDIFDNFKSSSLDNSNGVPAGSEDDVSLALAFDFDLLAGQTAIVTFLVSQTAPGGFFLSHTDADSDVTLYFSADLDIRGGQTPVPLPATAVLFGAGLGALSVFRRYRR
jgi:hypothetical protein